jgi:histidine triad (HIT) family protein
MAVSDCIFCTIVARGIPAEVVFEDEHALAFLDVTPRAPGHTVVVPKRHSPTLLDLPADEVGPLFAAVQTTARRVLAALQADGMTVGVNHGAVSGQTVPHLHVHIIPRFVGDRGGSIHSVVHNPPKESIAAIAERIRKQP